MKNKTTIRIIALFVLLVAGYGLRTTRAQQPVLTDRPMESLQLITDRSLYISGETIWLAVHTMEPLQKDGLTISKVVYAELFDSENKIIVKGKFRLIEGSAEGCLLIPQEQTTGVVYLRVYTQYLRNFHPNTLPLKALTVVNPAVPLTKAPEENSYGMQVSVSQGKLVQDLNSTISFRVPLKKTQELPEVALIRDDSTEVERLRIYGNGLGQFDLIPEFGVRYQLQSRYIDGDTLAFSLPEVRETGSLMRIQQQKNELVYSMTQYTQSPLARNTRYHLRVSDSRFGTLLIDSISGVSPVIEFRVDTKDVQEGICYFWLTDHTGKTLDFHPYYYDPGNGITLAPKLVKTTYAPGEQLKISLASTNLAPDETARVSLSVVKKGSGLSRTDLLPEWLIHQPTWSTPATFDYQKLSPALLAQIQIALDLSAGSILSNPNIKQELSGEVLPLKFVPELRNISISGYVTDKKTRSGISGTDVLLSYLGQQAEIHVDKTEKDGFFIFPLENYNQEQDLFLCTFDENPELQILINDDFSPRFPDITRSYPILDTSDQQLLEALYINHQLFSLNQQNSEPIAGDFADYTLGFGTPDISIRLDDYIDLPSMEVVLNEIVPFVKVRKRKGKYRLSILDSETGLTYENLLIMVDNIPLDQVDELMRIHPAKVEKVDVINRTYIIGDHVFQGVMMVTTLTENFGGITLPINSVFIRYPLFDQVPKFTKTIAQAPGPYFKNSNHRNVLFWDPGIDLTEDTEISFRTSEHRSTYQLIIRGITSEGRIVSGTAAFEVE